MAANREIKVYGTLVNATVNREVADANHNDALGYAYQIYDNKFGDSTPVNNFQDNVNKRVTAISYADGTTTIKNRAGVPDGLPYMFIVEGSSDLNGNVKTKNITADDIVAKTFHVSEGMTLSGDVIIDNGDLVLNDGDVNVDGSATISGSTTIGGSLDVVGNTNISSPVTINNSLNVAGSSSFSGPMTASGISSSSNVTAPNIASIEHSIDIINGDKNTEGSIKKAIDDLYNLLMGDPAGHHIDYDTINEIATFIAEHKDFAEALQTLVNQNKEDIVNLKAADTVLSQRITTNENDIVDVKADIQHLTSDVQNHSIRITNLEAANTQQAQDIAEIKEWGQEIDIETIEAFEGDVRRIDGELDTQVARLDGRIDSTNAALSDLADVVDHLSPGGGGDPTDTYTKAQIDAKFANVYTKTESDNNFYNKTYINNNVYTKTEIDNNIYTKTQIDNNIYNKTQIDDMVGDIDTLLSAI